MFVFKKNSKRQSGFFFRSSGNVRLVDWRRIDYHGISFMKSVALVMLGGDNAAGDHHFDAFFDRHRKRGGVFFRHKNEEAGGGIRRGGNEDVDHFLCGDFLNLTARLAGDESHRPDTLARKLDHDHFVESTGVRGGDGGDHLLGARVNIAHDWNTFQNFFAELKKFGTHHIGGDDTDQEDSHQGHEYTQSGNTIPCLDGSAEADEEFGEGRRKSVVQKTKKKVQDENGERNG